MFVAVSEPLPPGTALSFRLSQDDGSLLFQGRGEVIWVRSAAAGADRPSGVAIRFLQLTNEHQARLENSLTELNPDQNEPVLDTEPASGLLFELNVGEMELTSNPQISDAPAIDPNNDISQPETADEGAQLTYQSAAMRAGLVEPTPPVKPSSPIRKVLLWALYAIISFAVATFAILGPRVLGPPWQWFTSADSPGAPTVHGQGRHGPEESGAEGTGSDRPATALSHVKIEPTGRGREALVTLTGNGNFAPDQVRHFTMVDPPRVVICLSGITKPYHQERLATESPILKRVRFGFHEEVIPPELTIVFDVASDQVSAHNLVVKGNFISLYLMSDTGGSVRIVGRSGAGS
jgi:hypothetical protein